MAYDIGQAYVEILPSAEKFGSTLKSDLGGSTEEAGKEAGSKFASGLKTGLKAAGAALTAAATGVTALAKEVVGAYGEYEQLVGGVQKLFGEMDYQAVIDNASQAFKTAGMSANDYMETVTSFSASLISSLGGDTTKAVEYADRAIRDMSDNANTFGTDMQSIQNAYQGFAKQNYTMLDNLKLGYGGTKTEMERLITDAEKLDSTFQAARDTNGNLTLSYSDIIDAIHIVQENMNITGTTAKEAASTIEGSISTMKGAWENLITGMGDSGADIDKLTQDFVNSFETVIENIEPVIKNFSAALPEVLSAVLDAAADVLPDLIVDLLPAAIEGLIQLAAGLVTHIPQILAGVAEGLIDGISQVITGEKIFDKIFGPSETYSQYSGMLDDLGTAVDRLVSSVKNSTEEYDNSTTSALANADSARYLRDRLNELIEKEDKTATDKALIRDLVSELNGLVPGLALAYDEVTNSLNLTNKEMDRYIDNAYLQAKADAARQYLTDSLYDQYTAQQKVNESNRIFVDLMDDYGVGLDTLLLLGEGVTDGIALFHNELSDGTMTMKEANEAAELLVQAYNDNETAAEAMTAAEQNAKYAEEELYKATEALVEVAETSATSFAERYAQTFGEEVPQSLQTAIDSATDAGYQIPEGLVAGLETGDIELQNAVNRMNALVVFDEAISNAGIGGTEVSQSFVDAWLSGEYDWETANSYLIGLIDFSEAIETANESGEEVTAEFVNGLLDQYGLSGVVSAAEEIGEKATPSIVLEDINQVGASVAIETADGMADNTYQVEDAAQGIVDTITDTVAPLPDDMNTAGDEAGSNLDSAFGSWNSMIDATVTDTFNFFYDTLGTMLPGKMYEWGDTNGQKFKRGLEGTVDSITGVADNIASGIDSSLSVLPGWMEAAGYDGGAGLYNGLASWEGTLIAEAQYIAWQISSTIRAAWQSHSPSRLFTSIGESVGQGLEIGIRDSGELAIDATSDLSQDIVDSALRYDFEGNGYQANDMEDYMSQVLALLQGLQNLKVVMDSGEVVGVLAPGMSREFERIRTMQDRG